MPTFSKFIKGQRASQQLVDTDGYIYSRKKPKDTDYRPILCLAMPEENPSYQVSLSCLPNISDLRQAVQKNISKKFKVLYYILYYSDKMFDRTARENFQRPVVPNLFQICTRITLARLAICLRLPNTLAMRLSNFMMILMNYYVEFELSLS